MDVFVLTINKVACEKMLKHLKAHGFDDVVVVDGTRPRSAKPTIEELHDCICEGHYKCTKKFSEEGKHPCFIVFEDDCRFTVPNAYNKIMEAINFLDTRKGLKWGSLHVGHTPLGPIFPVIGISFLCRTIIPYTAHCYVLNGETARRLIKKLPKEKWKRPHMVEGLRQIPTFERFAFFPSIAIQNNNPKEMKWIVGDTVSYKTGVRIVETLAFTLTSLGCILLILAICILLFWVAISFKKIRAAPSRSSIAATAARSFATLETPKGSPGSGPEVSFAIKQFT